MPKVKSFSTLRKTCLLSLIIFLGAIFPLYQAKAIFIIDDAIAVLVFGAILQGILQILTLVSTLLLGLASLILGWVTGPYFTTLPYTSLENPIIQIGWTLTRDLTNIFFVLALVAIGLGTALRITGYQAKKALPTLIGIALLINFTPVILGLIVDASNILMNTFLSELGGLKMIGNQMSIQGNMLSGSLGDLRFLNPVNHIELMAKVFTLFIFNIIASFVFFAYAFLFTMRYIAIWVLVILSPFAFAAYVLPSTRSVFSKWWNQFFQWCIIGIVGAFFLYLSERILIGFSGPEGWKLLGDLPSNEGTVGFITKPLTDMNNEIMPYYVVLVFLIIGFITALTTSAAGAGKLVAGMRRGGEAGGKVAGILAGGGVKNLWKKSKTIDKTLSNKYPRAIGTTKGIVKGISAPLWGPGWALKKGIGKIPGARSAGKGLKAAFWEYGKEYDKKGKKIPKKPGILKAGLMAGFKTKKRKLSPKEKASGEIDIEETKEGEEMEEKTPTSRSPRTPPPPPSQTPSTTPSPPPPLKKDSNLWIDSKTGKPVIPPTPKAKGLSFREKVKKVIKTEREMNRTKKETKKLVKETKEREEKIRKREAEKIEDLKNRGK